MSKIDADEIVGMARKMKGWHTEWNGNEFGLYALEEGWIGDLNVGDEVAELIEQAPATILAQAAHIATLEARLAALGEELSVVGGWLHPHAELPPMTDGYRSEIVVVATEAQYHYKENRWILNSEPFGWKVQLPDPSEPPTAADGTESESE